LKIKTQKIWTPEEEEYLRANCSTMTAQEIADALNRTKSSIKHRKCVLGIVLKAPADWTDNELIFIRHNYPYMPVKEIAQKLNRTQPSVYNKIIRLGLKDEDSRYNKHWTQKELFYLEENWGKIRVSILAKHLNRPVQGVIDQAVRIQQLGPSASSQGYYTARGLATILEIDSHVVLNWIKSHGLKAKKKATRDKKKMYQIVLEDFKEWIEKHPEQVNKINIDLKDIV